MQLGIGLQIYVYIQIGGNACIYWGKLAVVVTGGTDDILLMIGMGLSM